MTDTNTRGGRTAVDDLGTPVPLPQQVRRVVSLVPSLTEAIASVAPELLVGATDWCTHPHDLDVARVRGTKNPDRRAIAALAPDLVVVNREENRELDVQRLRDAGIAVWVTDIRDVNEALTSLRRLFALALQVAVPGWLDEATTLWSGPVPPAHERVAVAVWRDPWMWVGSSTFAGDLLARCGLQNVFANHPERYPHLSVEEIIAAGPATVLLPSEPYPFTEDDGPEVFRDAARISTRLVDGRLLTWYGPSLVEAARVLGRRPPAQIE